MMNSACSKPTAPLAACVAGPLRVTYRDTDRMGYVYYSQYLVWFEIGRTTLIRQLGSTYRSWEDDRGVFLPVKSCEVNYLTPATYDDLVLVHTSMVKLTRASVTMEYEVTRERDGEVLAKGSTVHPFVDKAGRICRVADQLLPQFF